MGDLYPTRTRLMLLPDDPPLTWRLTVAGRRVLKADDGG